MSPPEAIATRRLQVTMNGFRSEAWIGDDGEIVRAETPFGLTLQQITATEALAVDLLAADGGAEFLGQALEQREVLGPAEASTTGDDDVRLGEVDLANLGLEHLGDLGGVGLPHEQLEPVGEAFEVDGSATQVGAA